MDGDHDAGGDGRGLNGTIYALGTNAAVFLNNRAFGSVLSSRPPPLQDSSPVSVQHHVCAGINRQGSTRRIVLDPRRPGVNVFGGGAAVTLLFGQYSLRYNVIVSVREIENEIL